MKRLLLLAGVLLWLAMSGTADAQPRDCYGPLQGTGLACTKHLTATPKPQTFVYAGRFEQGYYLSGLYAFGREFLGGITCRNFARLQSLRVRENVCGVHPRITYRTTAGRAPFTYRFQIAPPKGVTP